MSIKPLPPSTGTYHHVHILVPYPFHVLVSCHVLPSPGQCQFLDFGLGQTEGFLSGTVSFVLAGALSLYHKRCFWIISFYDSVLVIRCDPFVCQVKLLTPLIVQKKFGVERTPFQVLTFFFSFFPMSWERRPHAWYGMNQSLLWF